MFCRAWVKLGNTVVVIEHQLDVIQSADWVIDLGPEGGERGGHLVACGTPEEIARCAKSYTGAGATARHSKGYRRGGPSWIGTCRMSGAEGICGISRG